MSGINEPGIKVKLNAPKKNKSKSMIKNKIIFSAMPKIKSPIPGGATKKVRPKPKRAKPKRQIGVNATIKWTARPDIFSITYYPPMFLRISAIHTTPSGLPPSLGNF
jgi:hypothetical protein